MIERNQTIKEKDRIAKVAFSKSGGHQFKQVMKEFKKLRDTVDQYNEYLEIDGDKIFGPTEKKPEGSRTLAS